MKLSGARENLACSAQTYERGNQQGAEKSRDRKKLSAQGIDVVGGTPESARDLIEADRHLGRGGEGHRDLGGLGGWCGAKLQVVGTDLRLLRQLQVRNGSFRTGWRCGNKWPCWLPTWTIGTMKETAATAKSPPIPTHELLLRLVDMPLYDTVELVGEGPNKQMQALRLHRGKFDAYCPGCGKHTTWTTVVTSELEQRARLENAAFSLSLSSRSSGPTVHNWQGEFKLHLVCARDGRHHGDFYFNTLGPSAADYLRFAMGEGTELDPTLLVKVGQYPSLTEFQLGDLTEFEDGMSKQQRGEFVRATNSAAHGFNVAACVYFRRIFESVLVEARDDYMAQHGLTEWQEFKDARTDERIGLLRENIPKFMSEHPQLYRVLSLGIHELTEKQCAAELPMLRKSIELIMRDRVTAARQKREREEVSKLVAQAVDRHKD